MPFRIEFAPSAFKTFSELPPKVRRSLASKIDGLASDPYPPGAVKLSGRESLFRLRAGHYRVVYQVRERILCVLVVRVGHRGEVYRRLGK